jgi:hypothetical protein
MFWWKSHDWSNEEEVRLVVPGERGPKMTVVPHFLPRVILAKDMPADRVAQIRQWGLAREPAIPVLQTRWDRWEAKLVTGDA